MNVLELIRNGGFLAMAAAAAGLVGVLIGLVGFAVKGKSAVGLGVFTALLGTLAAGLGMIGTVYGKSMTDRALANVNPVDAELIRQVGFRESQDASWVGFGAALLPLLLGAGHVLRARAASSGAAPVVASLTKPPEENAAPIAGAALAFVGIGALAAAGAFVMARAPISTGKFGLPPEDHDGWDLARAISDVQTNPENGCLRLDAALLKFCAPGDGAHWPRVFSRPPPTTLDWRPAANTCVDRFLAQEAGAQLSTEAMLESPMVHDARLRGLVMQRQNEPNAAPVPPPADRAPKPEPKEPESSMRPGDVMKVIRPANPRIRACYEKALKSNPKLEGKIVVHFTIGPTGGVSEADEKSDPAFPEAAVTRCVLAVFKALKFPPHAGGPTAVNFPVVFKPAR